jgi:hypothetical protein
MIRLEDTTPGYYWIKIHKGNLNYIHYDNDKWIIVRISREISGKSVLSNIYFPKEDNYGKAKCSFKYFTEKVGNNYEGLIPIEEPKI